jgi:putative ABC transport system permease protein
VRWLYQFKLLVLSWIRPGRFDADLDEELRFHLDAQIAHNVERGLPLDEARWTAGLTLGRVDGIRDMCRDSRPGALFRQAVRDAAYGARLLRRTPGFSAAAILIVALGIGAVTAIFSVVDGVLLRPLPYAEPTRLVAVWSTMPRLNLPRALVNGADYQVWRRDNHVFTDIALVRSLANFNFTGVGEPERLFGARISPNLLSVLGVSPAIGRAFQTGEDVPGRDRVVLLSHALWVRRFGADRGIVGRTVQLNGIPYVVVGVMGGEFRYPSGEFEVWTPLTLSQAELIRQDAAHDYRAVARLRTGVTLEQARSEMSTIAARLEREFPTSNLDVGVGIGPLLDDTVAQVRPALYVLLAAVGCLLLIASLNLSNLLGARAAARQREFALRLSLGASRGRLLVQAIAEVVPLLAIGGVLGVCGAWWAVRAFIPIAPASLPRVENIAVNEVVIAVATATLMLAGVLAALVPAISASRPKNLIPNSSSGRTMTVAHRETRTAGILVVAQVALVLPLLVSAMLLARTFSTLTRVDPGFKADDVLSLHLAIPRAKYEQDVDIARFCTRIVDAVMAVPAVESVGMVNRLPLVGAQVGSVTFEGGAEGITVPTDWRTVTPGYFGTMGIPLREGRLFDARDTPDSTRVAIVDERLARTIAPEGTLIGKRFRIGQNTPWTEVVGVVGHVRTDGLDVDPRPQVYWPHWQRAQERMVLVVKTRNSPAIATRPIVDAVHAVDPDQPVYDVRTMEDVLERSLGQRWLNAALVGSFALMALALAAIGLYGVIAFGVTRRAREFGIRLALGANRRDVMRQVILRAMTLSSLGIGIGTAVAFLATSWIESLVFGVRSRDPVTLVVCAGVLLVVSIAAAAIPARWAAQVDPAITLRFE